MSPTFQRAPWFITACGAAALALCIMIALSPSALVYDEPYHLEGARLLAQGASIGQMLRAPLPSAPGPLYPELQALISPITGFHAPAIRWLNVILLFASVAAIAWSLRAFAKDDSWLCAAAILGTPMTWVSSGMALTEIPALAMASFSLAAGVWAGKSRNDALWLYLGFFVSGLFAGLAIMGRQTYLPIILAFPAVALCERRLRWPALAAFAVACAEPLPVFAVWHGITPPSQKHIGGGIAWEHGLLAFAYLAIVMAITAPQFYRARWKWILAAALAGQLANVFLLHIEWTAATGVASHLPAALRHFYPVFAGSLLMAAFFGFCAAVLVNAWNRRRDRLFLIASAEVLLLTATAFGITRIFSSRYVMTAFPLVFLMAQPFFVPSRCAALRVACGAALGWASLGAYYWPH